MKKIGVFTSGGDAPGMNACIRAVVRTAVFHGLQVSGIRYGYSGMIAGDIIDMDARSVSNIIQRGGTILKTSRSAEFMTVEGRKSAYENLVKAGVEGIVCIGGNGTFTGARIFYEEYGIPSIGVPGTIDNDLYGTDQTVGFDTAINTAVDAIDRIRDTAESHDRVFFIEVMGRQAGFIALASGIAGGAEVILVPEAKDDWAQLLHYFSGKTKKSFSIVVVAEGDEEGGAMKIVERLQRRMPDFEPRISILGHIQRGGSPTAADRMLASRLGYAAVQALLKGETNKMAGMVNNEVLLTSYEDAINKRKELDADLQQLVSVLSI